jgi:arsenate reductase
LDDRDISYVFRDIKADRPNVEELNQWLPLSKLPIRKFFNINGQSYRSLSVKDYLDDLPTEQIIHILAGDGMLVKRPLLVGNDFVLVGFTEEVWEVQFKKQLTYHQSV